MRGWAPNLSYSFGASILTTFRIWGILTWSEVDSEISMVHFRGCNTVLLQLFSSTSPLAPPQQSVYTLNSFLSIPKLPLSPRCNIRFLKNSKNLRDPHLLYSQNSQHCLCGEPRSTSFKRWKSWLWTQKVRKLSHQRNNEVDRHGSSTKHCFENNV
jgi:hypothetical protein